MNRKNKKELPLQILLVVILLFSCIFVLFGICSGFFINSFINFSLDKVITNSLLTLLSGTIYIVLLVVLIRYKDKEKIKTLKWYVNGILISLIFTFIISAVTIFTLGAEENNNINYLIGFSMFPLIGIITTFNVVKYVKKDTEAWKQIFYRNGNLHKIKKSKDYYRVDAPVFFENKVLSAVYKEQLKNLLVVFGIMIINISVFLIHIIREHSYSGNVIINLMELKLERKFGFIFFATILFLAFGIPIIAFYISNALKKIKVVKNHEYIAYHAIVSSVRNGKITIMDKNKNYMYKYCTCIGIKEKDVHFTSATLVFVPDDVLLYPDNNE